MGERDAAGRSAPEALAVILTLVCVLAGLLSGRPETAALAAPFAFLVIGGRTAARAAPRRAAGAVLRPAVSVRTGTSGAGTGSRVRLLVAADPAAVDGAGLIAIVLAGPGSAARALVLRRDEECPVLVEAPPSGEADVLVHASAGLCPDLVTAPVFVQAPPVRISILPPVGRGLPRPVAARLRGITGNHVSRRPGEGGELRTIAPLQPGDRIRRIDWRATARRSADQDRLMVRRSYADAEASVFLVLDDAHDLPGSTAAWFTTDRAAFGAGSLHHARSTAAAIAASYLSGGDRVGLDDLSGLRRPLRSTGGPRHLEQLRARLAATPVTPRRRRRRDPIPPPGSFVVLLSAFLDDEPARLLRLWHAQGHLVAGVDCMPVLDREESSRAQTSAVRLTLIRRRLRIEDLEEAGVPVLTAQPTVEAPASPDGATSEALLGVEVGLRILSRQRHRGSGGRTA